MVRAVGLEPTRHKHTPLKRACLPVPACSHLYVALSEPTHILYKVFTFLSIPFLKKFLFFLKNFCELSIIFFFRPVFIAFIIIVIRFWGIKEAHGEKFAACLFEVSYLSWLIVLILVVVLFIVLLVVLILIVLLIVIVVIFVWHKETSCKNFYIVFLCTELLCSF